jgi:hypothetical protein
MSMNTTTLETLYTAFAKLDHATMRTCYANDAVFEDEVFSLKGQDEIGDMWQMLCEATLKKKENTDVWSFEIKGISTDGEVGKAHWEAHYRFSSGRMVHNIVVGTFIFNSAGLIIKHHDAFNFYAWSKQALGMTGYLIGWTEFLQNKVRAQAAEGLRKFLEKKLR